MLAEVVNEVGLDENEYFSKIEQPDYKQKLRDTTEELAERGGFGSPTMFLDGDDMYFGNDRIELTLHKLHSS